MSAQIDLGLGRPRRVALVSCGSKKLCRAAPAKDLYQGALFKAARGWAEANADAWAILSAKHGLLDPEAVIDPYDARMPRKRLWRDVWGGRVLEAVFHRWCLPADPRNDFDPAYAPTFVLLAGADYCGWSGVDGCVHAGPWGWVKLTIVRPLQGLGIGQQLQWLRRGAARV